MRPARLAQLALLLEVSGTPKPGNVDRCRDHADLRFDHMLAGAVGAVDGLEAAEAGAAVGESFERAVAGMAAAQRAGNTQFGALLLLVPLVRAAAEAAVTPARATAVVEATTVADAAAFCRAFDRVDVHVGDPPDALSAFDVRRPARAAEAAEREEVTLATLMARSAAVDGIAREWTTGFERTFAAADALLEASGPVTDRAATVYLDLLAERPDPFVAKQHGHERADRVRDRARAAREGALDPAELADALVAEGVNPGTTADIVAGGLFVALERGMGV